MLWLALLLPDLPLQVFTRGIVDTPLAITLGHPRPQIIAASPQARAQGVAAGQSVAAALAVAPALQLRARAPALEAEALAEVASWASAFSPRVSLSPPDAVLIEIEASLKLFGGIDAIVVSMHDGIDRLGLQARIAIAPTPLAARWFAHASQQPLPSYASLDDWQGRLAALPLELLADGTEIGASTLELLAGIGMRTLGDLSHLPRAGLARRQASAVVDVLTRARGEAPDLQSWFVPPPLYAHRIALPAPVSHTEPLLFAARRLFAGLAAWLAARHAAVDRCCLELLHERTPPTAVNIVSGTPNREENRFLLLARERLSRLELNAPVEELRLTADAPVLFAPKPDDLFGNPGQVRDDAILLLDRLRARLGADSVHLLDAASDHRPEAATTGHPSSLELASRAARRSPPHAPAHRPLWLLPQPRALDPHDIALLDGPERLQGGWWDQTDIARDYYLARGPGRALWWVFHDLAHPGAWYVHGYFA
ncbi:MAG: DNA polymerase Y family protein [Thauera sp.]|nr:DNA polymerase Y family protein [Thauera sp.]